MAITMATGIFSGLDTGQIIDQLMALERRPLEKLSQKKAFYDAKISAYGSLSSTLETLKTTLSSLKGDSIFSMSTSSSDESVFTATASSLTSEGTYTIKVNNIATAQSVYSAQFSTENSAIADLSTYATQKLQIQVGNNAAVEIDIDSSNNTLTGIKDAINNANTGIRASVISDDGTNYRLVISSESTGASNRIVIKVDEDYDGVFEESPDETDTTGLSRLAFNATYDSNGNVTGGITSMTQSQAAVDASLEIDGLSVTRSSNTIDDLITGVTIDLHDDSSGNTLALNITKDISQIIANVESFVSSYSAAMSLARSLSVPSDGQAVILTGDSTARGMMTSLRSAITTSFKGNTPSSFGLSHDKEGVLSLDTSMLEDATGNDLQSVMDTFDAMAESLEDTLDNYMDTLIPARTDGLNNSIDLIEDRVDTMERRLDKVELNYIQKFTLLEQTLSQLQQNGDFLTQQLTSLSSITNGGKKK